jgi:hypothetical protein
LIEQASNIAGRQIAFGRWAGVEYTIHETLLGSFRLISCTYHIFHMREYVVS